MNMYTTITSLLLLVATNKLMAGEGICQRRHQVETIAVCDEEYSKYCCPNIHLHDGSLSNRHFQKCKGGNMSCKGGFYSRDGSTSPCPLGYFCPHGRRCMVPCFSGDYCPGYQMIDNTTCTHPVEPSLQPLVINNTTVCPGDYRNRRCQKGFYCPIPWEKVECPPGKKCLEGFSYPLRCNMFGKCDFGGGENTVGFLVLFALALVIAIILVLKYRLRRRSMLLREEVACFLKQADDQEDSRDSPVSRSPSLSSLKMMRSSRKKSRSHFNIPAALWSSLKVDITGYRESLPKINNAFTIQLEDFAYTLKSGRKLLRGIDVTFQHSKINVIMGPSGCGKSTLINSIMGYNKDNGHTSGNLYLNGVHIKTLSKIKNYVGYLTQHDIMHDNLTVKEILTYQAQLKLPEEDKDNAYITSSVTEVINLLALNQIGDRVVGNLDDNLISGGQRRRLSIAMELITNPSILILDEPTSGLDSATALIIMQLLRNLSHQMRINIICIIHQPRVELFSLFDNLTLLTTTGRVAYNAQASLIKDYFRNLGFTFPDHANPADIIIDILSGFIVSEEYEVRHLYKVWKKEQNKREVLSASVIDLLDGVEGSTHSVETLLSRENPQQLDKRKMTSRGYFDQWLVMMHRECVSDIRFFHHRLAEIVIAFVLGLGMAFLFRDLVRGMETTKVNLEIVTVGLLVSVSSLRTFGRDRLIFLREAKSGVHTFSYFFAKTIVHLPTICFFIPAPFVGIYWTGGDFKGSFGFTYLLVTLAAFAASGISYLISVVCKPNLANLMSIGVTLISSMFAGCTLTLCDLDSLSGLGPLLYSISYSRWFVQSQLISEWSTYDQTYKMYFDRRFWMNKYTDAGSTEGMIILFIFGVLFRFLTLMVLFYQKANISILHEIRLFLRERKERKRERRPESNVTMSDFKARLKTYDRRQKQTLI